MTDRPTPEEAARALQDVERRREQGLESVGLALWVRIVFAVVIFADLAAPDFFGSEVRSWTSTVFAVAAVAYVVMLRTRQGSTILGRPTRLRRQEISPRFVLTARLAILAVVIIGAVIAFTPHASLYETVPYLSTGIGAVFAIVLVFGGDRLQRALVSQARTTRPAQRNDAGGNP